MGLCLGSLSRELHPATPSTTTPATCTMASSSSEGGGDGKIMETPNLKKFSFKELKSATKNFNAGSLLAEGGTGIVFKGWMDEKTLKPSKVGTGMAVAIKIFLKSENMQDVQSEVDFLGRLDHHPNLARLVGYCWEDKKQLLVYEYVQRGSLENHLFRSNAEPFSWDMRLKIAIGAARGLAFLQTSDYQVKYIEFKTSNILLDGNYNAKISIFGLAKLGPSGSRSHLIMTSMGRATFSYAAPDYIHSGHLCVKTVVYGFGVVQLEMLTGLQAFDGKKPKGQENMVECWKPCLSSERKLKTIMDPRMKGQYSSKAALQAAQLILQCLEFHSRSRPSMKEVVEALEGIEAMKEKLEESKINSICYYSINILL